MTTAAVPRDSLTVAELSSRERRDLARSHPEIAGHGEALLVAGRDAELLRQAMVLVNRLQQRSERMNRTIEALLPPEIPGRAAVLQARRNAEARPALLREFGALSSLEVADLAGSRARNRAALANRWRQEGRIFAFTHRGQRYFAGYQFGPDGRPLPVIAEVIGAFGRERGGWQTALWFTSSNGWLGGERPVDRLADAPQRVADAARREAAGLVF